MAQIAPTHAQANLPLANLKVANLKVANLQEADLQGADLQGADLQGAAERSPGFGAPGFATHPRRRPSVRHANVRNDPNAQASGAHPLLTQAALAADDPLRVGWELGQDHARWGVVPPPAHLHGQSPVRQGWQAARGRGRAAASDTLPPALVAAWLDARLAAWQRGVAFEAVRSPAPWRHAAPAPCPVRRTPMPAWGAGGAGADAPVLMALDAARRADAGNLVVCSTAAARAREGLALPALLRQARDLAAAPAGTVRRGLDAAGWQRLAVLTSLATPLAHGQAACLPMVVLPHAGAVPCNPVQALQAALTLAFVHDGWSARLAEWQPTLTDEDQRIAFRSFANTLVARRIEAGAQADATTVRRVLEDAWTDPLLLQRWQRLVWRWAPDAARAGQRLAQVPRAAGLLARGG